MIINRVDESVDESDETGIYIFLCITSVHKIEIDLENIILYNIINYI